MRVDIKKHERVEVIVEGAVYVVMIRNRRPVLMFSHMVGEES
jgi:hypothetical protein